ncbi:MAG: hypothetical protein A2X45_13915 [Lentisphaerae bacterium GWF2_50_93]|nr:MAG: hypothetical protein A2X45_13915 [Lentisphaerae bacterium GWF2_50_93]
MFLLGASIALGILLSSQTISNAVVRMKQANNIRVKGLAEEKIVSNHAAWLCEIRSKSGELRQCFDELDRSKNAVQEYLKTAGVPDAAISLKSIVTDYEYKLNEKGQKTNTLENYILTQVFEIRTSDVKLVDKVSKSVTELIRNGIQISSFPPEYVNVEIEDIKMRLLAKATANGYERANILARNSNGKVGLLNSASQGVFQITPLNSTDVSDSGQYDTSTIEKTVKAVVTLEFNVEGNSRN